VIRDPRRFLGAEELVLPYIGGPFVHARGRRLEIDGAVEPGYWRFEVRGRVARALASAAAPSFAGLPVARGHNADGYAVHESSRAEWLFLVPDGDLPRFAPVTARRWPPGVLLHESTDYETGVEEEARRAYEDRRSLADVKGAPATLRAAFGYAVLLRAGREAEIPVTPMEARGRVGEIVERGETVAHGLLRDLERERARQSEAARRLVLSPATPAQADERIEVALRAAGGSLQSVRGVGDDMIEVRYILGGERFVSIVDARSLQVVDAGICLSGADRELTMESLPGVICEAIDTDELNITRRW
jgi:hypothetical protein